jgi:subtilisin family serine protease
MARRLARVALALATLASTASLVSAGSSHVDPVATYVVSFPHDNNNATTFVSELFAAFPAARVFKRLRGAALPLRASQARALRERHPDAIVERDARVAAQGFRSTRASLDSSVSAQSRRGLHWGLDRVDQRALPLDGRASRHPHAGAGALLYVVDSGVMAAHDDFTGRVVASIHARPSESPAARARADAAGGDCYGHGTAVASLAAGASSGLAPAARIVSVRVLDCAGNGRVSDVVAGLEAVAEHAARERARATARAETEETDEVTTEETEEVTQETKAASTGGADADRTQPSSDRDGSTRTTFAALTLSLGVPAGFASRALDAAVRKLSERHDVAVFVAAGNARGSERRGDACRFSPGRSRAAITIGASDRFDRTWSDGMTGRCVDLIAPGVDVPAASADGTAAFVEWTGTSMAAPAAAGAALAIGAGTPEGARAALAAAATRGALRDDENDQRNASSDEREDVRLAASLPGTPNLLLFHRSPDDVGTKPEAVTNAAAA